MREGASRDALSGPGARVRAMLEADLDGVLEVEGAAYNFPWNRRVFRDCLMAGYSCWVLEEYPAKLLKGFAVMSMGAGEAHILNLCVAPQRHRQGLGKRLLVHLCSVAEAHSVRRIFLEVRPSNAGAVALYRQAGFAWIGQRKGYYPAAAGREDADVMALDIG